MFVEQPPSLLGTVSSLGSSQRRARALADIVPSCGSLKGSLDADCRGGGSLRMTSVTGGLEGRSRFPKLEDCAHFHYDHVELGPIQLSLYEEEDLKPLSSLESNNENCENKFLTVKVNSGGQSWLLRRTYDNFRMLDKQLHRCIYDRKFSALPELPHPIDNLQEKTDPEAYIRRLLIRYLERLSHIAGSLINCGPVLSWLELDNRGRRLLVTGADNCLINTPAVAAAYAIKRYSAIAADEISFDVGDMISVIDMPPPEESSWWRGKKGFLVGFFPFHCVAVITDKVPRTLNLHQVMSCTEPSKPVLRKHGKLIAFFRAFILARPSRRRLKQTGILRERVFGCDLGEHLLNSGHDIPMVLKCCADFIEKYGLVDGIYRLSGVTSNIQKLRTTFDEDRVPKLYEDEAILQDIHSVASLLKMYFRELPNPLCTYQLYHGFVLSVQQEDDNQRLAKMRETVQKLPPPHYRTLEYLMHHLARVAERGESTGMTARNVAIVWAPNLLRCKELELGGVAALQVVGVQAVVTEFLIRWQHLIFTSNIHHLPPSHAGTPKKSRPKSLAVSTPTRLLSLEEAQSRVLLGKPDQDYIEVGGGPSCLPKEYHTIIELPSRKRGGSKRSPLGWKSLFSRGSSSVTNSSRKSRSPATCKSTDKRKTSIPSDIKFGHSINETESQLLEVKTNLRPVKSAESLTSGSAHNSARNSSCLETPIIRQLTTSPPSQPGHNRSSSHDSYFDHLAESTPEKTRTSPVTELDDEGLSLSLDLSELQVNFELEESEMRIFSEDETNQLFTSPSNCEQVQTLKRQPMLALTEDSLSSDPSPKKHKTDNDNKGDLVTNNLSKRCRLEERLSSGELQYIDSQSPEQILAHVDIHSHIGCEESQRSPSLAEATLSENESMTLSMTSGTPRLNYTPLTEDSLSDGNILTPEYSLLKFSASSFHSPSSLEANSPADSPFSSNKNVRHSYQDSSNLQSEALLPCSRLSFPGFLTSPISHAANNSLPNHQYELLENEKESSIAEDSKNVSVTSNSESGLLNDSDSSSNDVSGINLNLSDNIYENVECGDKKLSPTIAVYENMSISNDDNIKYEPIDNCESESCYEDVFIGSNFLVNDSLRKVPVSNQNENEENVGLIQEEVSSMNDSSSSNSSPDCKSQSMLGANRIYDNLQEETTYENVPDSKQLYQQVKYFKRSVTEINELIDSQPSSLIQVNNSSNKSMDVDIVSDDIAQSHKNLAASSRSIDAKTESPSMTTENVTAKRLHSPVKQSNKVGVTGETQNVTGSLNTNNEPCTAPSRLTLDNKKPTVSSNIENDSSHERNSEQQTETGISNLDSTKSVHQLLSCFECSSDEFSRRKFRGKDGSDKMSLSADSLKSLPGDSPEKKKATSEASRIPILEKVPENESDLDRRKRIEKYKEERRNYLRQKFSMENLKNSANEESDVLRRYKQKADSNKEENSFSDKSNIKSDKDLIKNKLNESQKCSLDTSSKTTVENAHSRSSVLDKCLNLELKKSPPAQISSSKTNFKKPLYTRSASDNSGLLSPSRTMISICYSPTRKNVSQEEEGKTSLPPMVLQDEIISVKDSKTTCVTIKHKDGDEEKSCAVLSNAPKSAKSNIGAEYSSRERNTTNFTSSPEKRGSKEKLVSPDKQSLVSQRVIQLTGPSDGNTQSATRKTSLSHQKQPPAGTNRQRAHSTSERMTPYCIKDMAALFEKPEELSKKS